MGFWLLGYFYDCVGFYVGLMLVLFGVFGVVVGLLVMFGCYCYVIDGEVCSYG